MMNSPTASTPTMVAPVASPGAASGNTTVRVWRQRRAPRSEAASRIERGTRDNAACTRALAALTAAARTAPGEVNLMEKILDAARAYATEGEIRGAMREVFGDYVETPEF